MSSLNRSHDTPWRSLDELAGDPMFRVRLATEFPTGAAWLDEVEAGGTTLRRRRFIQLMGASFALGGLTGCGRPTRETIVPYVNQPENMLPGHPAHYASAVSHRSHARGVLVTSEMGRPTKIEGNPEHPASLGATDAAGQATVLDLYDPDRARLVKHVGRIATWNAFLEALRPRKSEDGFAILIEPTTSPTLQRLLGEMTGVHIYQHAAQPPVPPATIHDFSVPDVILAIDDDFLTHHPESLRITRQFVARRRPGVSPNRLYVIEPTPTLTGAMADHRLPVKPSRIPAIARAAAGESVEMTPAEAEFFRRLRDDLEKSAGRVLVTGQVPAVLSAHSISGITAPPTVSEFPGIHDLAAAIAAGSIRTLLILGGNPAYQVPGFGKLLGDVEFTAHLGSHEDETSAQCHWSLPEAHFLETWGDIRAYDGTPTVQQPLIEPLYEGRSAIGVLAPDASPLETIRATWLAAFGAADGFEDFWKTSLHDGFAATAKVKFAPKIPLLETPRAAPAPAPGGGIELVVRPDSNVGTGAQSNNGWLQELPRPFTKLVWDNVALISPALAKRLALKNGDVVTLEPTAVTAPIWVLPGQADETVTVHMGYGRRAAGQIGNGVGFDAFPLVGTTAVTLGRTGKTHELVSTQDHSAMEGRDLIWRVNPAEVAQAKFSHRPPAVPEVTLYPDPKDMLNGRYAWAMSIDLSACTGCNACVLACQAENNIPVVGKSEVARGREMHWIRLDRYYIGENPDAPRIVHQPVTCQHCEQAPCEVVCPVEATIHTADGLNAMVYNRCVGTRYCSNNCPYKVRRFNFFDYRTKGLKSDPRSLQANPNVTVRGRGVMEKCTYCVQRIQRAVIAADRTDGRVKDGEIVTACQQACPAEAIIFGDLRDPESRVSKLRREPTAYSLLGQLNTRPRTTYLAKLENPHV